MVTRRRFLRGLASLGIIGLATSTYAVVIEPRLRPRITRYDLKLRHWPDDLHLTMAVVADLHACKPWMELDRIHAIVRQTNELGADLVVLLGDYTSSMRLVTGGVRAEDWSKALSALQAPLGVHAILGNHDWWADKTAQTNGHGPTFGRLALERVGIPVYENDVVKLAKSGHSFWLAGLGDQLAFWPSWRSHPQRPMGVDNLAGTLSKVTEDEPIILLAHEPDIMPQVPDRVSLILSGHTHGGQVRLFGWSPVVPSRFGNRYAYGHIREQCDLIVSGGLGCSIVPVRFGMLPEIVLVSITGART
jgi:uncharacterized protein